MVEALKRATRTFLQAFLGALLTSGVLSAITEEGVVEWGVLKKVAISAAAAGSIAAISFVQNALENNRTIPALLKTVPDPGTGPTS